MLKCGSAFAGFLAAVLLVAPNAALAISLIGATDLIVFGDSIVDAGNVATANPPAVPSPPYSDGRFSNGPVIADFINTAVEGAASTASLLGGDNWGWGGARTVGGAVPDLVAQVGDYLTSVGNVADPNAIYLMNVGGNDVFDILSAANPQLQAAITIPTVAGTVSAMASSLQAAGAQNILFVGVGNVGATPAVQALSPATQIFAQQVSVQINGAILNALPTGVEFFFTIPFFDAVLADPEAFGLPGTLDTVNACTSVLPVDFPTCAEFAFLDPIHPTTQIHEVWGQAILAQIPEPGTGLLLAFGLIGIAARRRAA